MSHLLAAMHLLGEGPIEWIEREFFSIFNSDELQSLVGLPIGDDGVYGALWKATMPAAMGIAASAAIVRFMKMVADPKVGGTQIITDLMVRSIVAVGLIQASFAIVTTIFKVSISIAWRTFVTIGTTTFSHELADQSVQTGASGAAWVVIPRVLFLVAKPFMNPWGASAGPAVARLITARIALALVALLGIVMVIYLIYIIIMMIARFLLSAMVIAMAPVCVALTVFEPKNRFTEWWVEALIGTALIPIVLAFSLAITITLFLGAAQGVSFPLLAPIVLIGGLWLTGKMMHKLTWRHFSHGGPIGAISAGFAAAWAIPQLAFEGHMIGKAMGVRKGQGLMGIGAERNNPDNPSEITKQGVLGNAMDVGINAVYGKSAAIYSYGAAEQHQKSKSFGRYAQNYDPDSAPKSDGVNAELAIRSLQASDPAAAATMGNFGAPGTMLLKGAKKMYQPQFGDLSDDALVGKIEGGPLPNGADWARAVPYALGNVGLAQGGTTTTSSTPAPSGGTPTPIRTPAPAGGGPVAAPVTQASPNSPPGERPVPAWAARDGVDLGYLRPGYGADAADDLNRDR